MLFFFLSTGWLLAVALIAAAARGFITIQSVSVYLHRWQTHESMTGARWLEMFYRFWLWTHTAMKTKEWVAVHRKHHAFTDKSGDPHSPLIHGIRRVLFLNVRLYQTAAADTETIKRYAHGVADDWWERRVFSPHNKVGVALMFIADLLIFGPWGLAVSLAEIAVIPVGGGVINGLGHWLVGFPKVLGYRNYETTNDQSRNILCWDLLLAGEGLHNNHHAKPRWAKFAHKRWEFDISWMFIRLYQKLGWVRCAPMV